MEKQCTSCGVVKCETEFWKRDGGKKRHNQCRGCLKKYHQAYYQKHGEIVRENARQYYYDHIEEQRAAHTRWRLKNKDKPEFKRYQAAATRAYNAKHRKDPEFLARKSVYYAVKAGHLVRKPCEVCGFSGKTFAHHHNGYDIKHWLDVQWLCYGCHCKAHGKRSHSGG